MPTSDFENVEDVYPLAPVQEGMLFHVISSESRAVYFAQHGFTILGSLNVDALQTAWNEAVHQHPILRTAFLWDGLDEPLQVVRESVELPFELRDWTNIDSSQIEDRFEQFLQQDRQQGFEIDQAPLLRIALLRIQPNEYRCVWSFHHMINDGWALSLIIKDVWDLYAAKVRSQTAPEVQGRPYREYVDWVSAQDWESAKSFWQMQLANFVEPIRLRSDHANEKSRPAERLTCAFSKDETDALRNFSKSNRLTINSVIQGAWAFTLSRVARHNDNRNDVVFGVAVSGRSATFPHSESIVGPLLNTLPLRVQIDDKTSVVDWLQKIQLTNLQMRQYEHVPLSKIQRWSDVANEQALFETLVSFENLEVSEFDLPDLKVADPIYFDESNYPLALLVFPEEQLRFDLLYQHQQLSAAQIDQIGSIFSTFLRRMVAGNNCTVAEFPTLCDEEITIRKNAWKKNTTPIPDVCIHDMIAEAAAKTPDAIAVRFDDESLTYQQLMKQSAFVSKSLVVEQAGEPIALLVERSPQMIIGILAILQAGGAYVPLDPAYPDERLKSIIVDCGARFILTTSDLVPELKNLVDDGHNVVTIDHSTTVDSSDVQQIKATPPSNAYLIYTSGSTGKPKGVAVSHRNLVHSTVARHQYYGEFPKSFLLLSSFSFDSSVAGIFWTLCGGGTLVLPQEGEQRDIERLSSLIAQHRVTQLLTLPSLCDLLFQFSTDESLQSLDTVIVAGEECTKEFVAKHRDRIRHLNLFNEYGPTEASVWCTVAKVDPQTQDRRISIGNAIPNARVYIVDQNGHQAATGVEGELCVAGEGICAGYWNNIKANDEKFVSDLLDPQSKMYRTGDLAVEQEDGSFVFLGRIDHQLKVRGFRIEPGEIEELIRSHASVQEAVVALLDSSPEFTDDQLLSSLSALDPEEAEQLLSQIEANDGVVS